MIRRLLLAGALLALFAAGAPAEARCVLVGADGISHTACDLP